MMSAISIIMPVYNSGAFLQKTLSSLLNQTFKDIEVICINDGSKDNSLQILQEFREKDPRIIVFDQPNSGPAAARNNGLKNMTGKYVMFCDSDDWYEPTMCEKMHDAMENNDIDFAMCDANIVDEIEGLDRGDSLSYYKLPFVGYKKFKNYRKKLKINAILWNKIFKKEVIDEYNISFPDGCFHDDDAFIFQYLVPSHSAIFLTDKLYNYFRREKESIMAAYLAGASDSIDRGKITHFVYNKLKENNLLGNNNDNYLSFFITQTALCYKMLYPSLRQDFTKSQLNFISKEKIEPKSQKLKRQLKMMMKLSTMNNAEVLHYYKKKRMRNKILKILTLGLLKNLKKNMSKQEKEIAKLENEKENEKSLAYK